MKILKYTYFNIHIALFKKIIKKHEYIDFQSNTCILHVVLTQYM